MTQRIQHFVKGRKDGKLRLVQHIPQNADVKETRPTELRDGKVYTHPNHFIMLLGEPATAQRAFIREDRIITVKTEAAGLPI